MKSILILIALSISATQLFSQRVELQLSAGQGFSKGGSPLSSYDESQSGDLVNNLITTIQNRDDTYFSIGQGSRGAAQANLYLSDNLGIFTALSYSAGSQTSKVNNSYPGFLTIETTSDNTSIKYSSGSIQAGLQFQSQEGLFEPFAGIGAGYFFPITLTTTEDYSGTHTETQSKTNAPIGYISYVGINLRISPNVAFFISARATLVTYYITRTEITDYSYNGVSQLSSRTTNELVTVYDENKDYTTSSANDANLPRNGGPPIPAPASTLAIMGGFSFKL